MINKPEQAQRFLAALTGDVSPAMTWQRFCDYDKDRKELATWWHGYLDTERLNDSQAMGCGVFFCVNGSSTGGRSMADINIFRAVFMDSDGEPLPAHWPVQPHALVMRDATHYHAYWFLDGDCSPDEWTMAQKQIAMYFNSDERMVNPDRVMRVPGFTHQKDIHNPVPYELAYLDEQLPRYKLRSIIGNFRLDEAKMQKMADWLRQRAGVYLNGTEDFDDREANCAKYIDYLTKRAEIAISGQGGNTVAFKTSAAGRDYGLSPEKTYELMMTYWDSRCIPPWGEEVWGVIQNAYRYNQNKLGSRSLGIFLDEDVTPLSGMSATPVNSVIYVQEVSEKKEKEDAVAKIAEIRAAVAPGQILSPDTVNNFYGKNHTQNAIAYLSINSPNGEVILSEEDIYVFNGRVFEQKPGKHLHGVMARELEYLAPSNADVDGSVSMIKHHLMRDAPQKWPEWKSAPERDTSGLIVFENGVLDILTNEWFDHTPLLRARNMMPYSYDHAAKCPEWDSFLANLWGGSKYEPLIGLLQMWFGYMLTDDQSQQKMGIFIGKPRSGKGTIMRVMEDMLGEHNCASPSLDSLTKDAMLHNMSTKMAAIFNDVADPSPGARNAIVGALKRIVGEDSLSFDRKFKSAQQMRFKCRVNMTCNAIPNLSESSTAMLDRGLFFYTPNSYAGKEDLELGDRLKAEMPGIINWAIAGLQRLREVKKLRNDPCMDGRIRVFRMVTSPLEVFTEDQLIMREDAYSPIKDVFTRYRTWAFHNDGGGIKSLGTFSRMMDAMKGMELDYTSDGVAVLRGAFLVPIDDEPEMGRIPE